MKYKCCVAFCTNDSDEKGILFHQLPSNPNIRKEWINKLKNLSKSNIVHPNIRVCSIHFVASDYFPANEKMKKTLKRSSIPSINLEQKDYSMISNNDHVASGTSITAKTKHSPNILSKSTVILKDKYCLKQPVNQSTDDINSGKKTQGSCSNQASNLEFNEGNFMINGLITNLDICDGCNQNDSVEIPDTFNGDDDVEDENVREIIKEANDQAKIQEFKKSSEKRLTLLCLIRNDDDLLAFTGVSAGIIDRVTRAAEILEGKKNGSKFSNSIHERVLLCFCKLYLNLSYKCLACLFDITRQTASKNFLYMVDLLSKVLKDMVYWPTHEETTNSMPKCFQKYSDTYVVLDCTEIPVEKPSCLACRLRMYSHYKGCETVKFLISVAPCGFICNISNAFGGRASDKAIFNQSGIIDVLEPTRDAIMIDKGFDIEGECASNFIKLYMPPKLKKKNKQFTKEESLKTQTIAAARVHVERSIQRLKLFKIVKQKIPWELVPYIDNISQVVAGLVNLGRPILADNKF